MNEYKVYPKEDAKTEDGHSWTWGKSYKANRNEDGFWVCSNEGICWFDQSDWHIVDEKFVLDEV